MQAPWIDDTNEPEYSHLRDYEGEPIQKNEEYLDLYGEFYVPYAKVSEFLVWYINNYRTEAEDLIWDELQGAGIWRRA